MMISRLAGPLIAAALASLTAVVPARSAPVYELTPLDPPPGYTELYPNAINTPGQVVGTAIDPDTSASVAAVWRHGSTTALGTLGGWHSSGSAVNDAGLVVGEAWTASAEQEVHAFVWDGDRVQDLGVDGRDSGATGINSAGAIVGYERDRLGNAHAMLWEHGVGHRLDRFEVGFSSAVGINDAGQIVVVAYTSGAGGSPDSYLSDGGALTWLGSWHQCKGQVVGSTLTPAGVEHAVVWEDGTVSDLNDAVTPASGWELWRATAINDGGQIVGFGTLNGQPQAFMLTPN